MVQKAVKAAFPPTLPVLAGYLFLGIAFGLLLSGKGYGWSIALLMSTFIFAGSMQFVAVSLMTAPLDLGLVVLMTLLVNARHIFYGLSMLEKFRDLGKEKLYLIFALTDETYSLLCSAPVPEEVPKGAFYCAIAALDHSYWIVGSVLGALGGSLLSFEIGGIDFVMTALFVVIFVEQWENAKIHTPAVAGVCITLLSLLIVGSQWFLIPSMGGILLAMMLLQGRLEGKDNAIIHP